MKLNIKKGNECQDVLDLFLKGISSRCLLTYAPAQPSVEFKSFQLLNIFGNHVRIYLEQSESEEVSGRI